MYNKRGTKQARAHIRPLFLVLPPLVPPFPPPNPPPGLSGGRALMPPLPPPPKSPPGKPESTSMSPTPPGDFQAAGSPPAPDPPLLPFSFFPAEAATSSAMALTRFSCSSCSCEALMAEAWSAAMCLSSEERSDEIVSSQEVRDAVRVEIEGAEAIDVEADESTCIEASSDDAETGAGRTSRPTELRTSRREPFWSRRPVRTFA